MPVVGVEDLRWIELQDFEDGPAEEGEPLGVIGVITIWGVVEIISVEVVVSTDEVNWDAIPCLCLQQRAFLSPMRDGDSEANPCILQRETSL